MCVCVGVGVCVCLPQLVIAESASVGMMEPPNICTERYSMI